MTPDFPTIPASRFDNAPSDTWEYLNIILGAYQEALAESPSGERQHEMTLEQHSLMAYAALHSHVSVGGFIQLIQNGYGAYLFENPFAETFRTWGASQVATLIEEAHPIYLAKQTELERETTLEEFAKMYDAIPDFDAIDKRYEACMDAEATQVVAFVKQNLGLFVVVG